MSRAQSTELREESAVTERMEGLGVWEDEFDRLREDERALSSRI